MPFISLAQCQLYYQEEGQGPAIVYVHGGFAGLDTVLRSNEWEWEHSFTPHCRFITYDRRGCARSSSPANGYDLVTQARDLQGLLAHLEIPIAHIIGSSSGGPVAFYFAALYPQCVRSLILVGTAIDLFPLGETGSDMVRRQLVILEREGAAAAFAQRPHGVEVTFNELWDEPEAVAGGNLEQYRARVAQRRALVQDVPTAKREHYYATELRSMEAYMTTAIRAHAEAVQVPTYVLQGSNDQMVPVRDAKILADTIPSARLEVIQDGPHSLMAQCPAAREKVFAWIRRIEGLGNHA